MTLFSNEGHLMLLQEWDVMSLSQICPLPVLNSQMKVYISHADESGIFLHKSSYTDLLADLLQRLFDHYEQAESQSRTWGKEDLCCAKSVADEQWYRAYITEILEEGIRVIFVDYGNSEVVPYSNLRTLDPSFYAPHALSLKVAFHVTWNVGLENLLELAGETEYNAMIVNGTDSYVAELVDNSGQSLTEKLVELGFASELENSPFKRVVEGGRFVEGSNVPVSVSFVDSPLQLWIFVGNDIELIEALQDRLQEAAPKLPCLKEPNGVFAAKFSDGLWYRAIKLENSTVRFIDYGNSDSVDLSDIKSLSSDFVEPAEGYAVKFELPVADFKEGATERLNDLVISQEIDSEEEIIAHILSVKECSIVADIIKGGKSVVDTLVEENLATRVQKITSGFVSHFNALDDFFIQEEGCEESLEGISNTMLTADQFEPLDEINEGNLVAALCPEDDVWYRGKVTKKSEEGIEVVYIDYGNSSIVSDYKKLPDDLAVQPVLSKHCALQLPSGVSKWSEAASEKFLEISADGTTQFDIKVLNEESPATVILCSNGSNVGDELKSLCEVEETGEASTASATAPVDLTGYDKTVYISHANGVDDFYIQVDGAETELDEIKESLSDTTSFETVEKITEADQGKVFGAFFEDDEQWYRAKVLNLAEEGSEVLFIDYGNSSVSTKFLKLPEDLENRPPVALNCSLDIIKEQLNEGVDEHFITLSGEGTVPFAMKVVKEGNPTVVSLLHEEKIVEQEISNLFGEPQKEDKYSTEAVSSTVQDSEDQCETVDDSEIIKSVFLIQVNSPSDFYLHTSEGTQLLGDICEKLLLADDYTSVEDSLVSVGNVVAAQIDEDDLWYRAKILDRSQDETKVLFIDYGNTVKVAKIKNLPEELLTIPPLAMHCSLQVAGNTEWSESARALFNKMANEEGSSFDLKIVSEGEPKTVMLYNDGQSVAEQLISASDSVKPSVDSEDEKEIEMVSSSIEVKDEKNLEEQKFQLENEMKNLLLTSMETKIDGRLYKDMQDITDSLISTAISNSEEDKMAGETTDDANQLPNDVEDITIDCKPVESTTVDSETITDLKSTVGEVETDSKINNQIEDGVQETIDKTIAQVVENNVPFENHNGSATNHEETTKETNETERIEGKLGKKLDENHESSGDSFTSVESKDVNSSPPTPRRNNIDDHIVPGCISSVKLEDTKEQS